MPDTEIAAMGSVADALAELDPEGQRRVLHWAADRFGVALPARRPKSVNSEPADDDEDATDDDAADSDKGSTFEEFADLFNACGPPKSEPDKALVAGFWMQIVQGAQNVQSQQLNSMLKDLGHPIGNITQSMTSLINRKPGLVMQTKKAGNTQQARKTYKLTHEGIKSVKAMLG